MRATRRLREPDAECRFGRRWRAGGDLVADDRVRLRRWRGRADGRYDAGSILRYVIEVMGFDDAEYESGKAGMHARMGTLGRLFRMEAPQFDSSHNPLRRQRESIGAEIRSDIVRRWGRT